MLQAKHIANAIFKASQKDGANISDVIKNTISYLKQKGAIKLIPKVLKELDKIHKKELLKKPTIKIYKKEDLTEAVKDLKITDNNLNVKFDNTLLGGYIYKKGGKVIINDYKHHLIDLYKKIISSV